MKSPKLLLTSEQVAFQPSTGIRKSSKIKTIESKQSPTPKDVLDESLNVEKPAKPAFPEKVDTLIIGLIALDTVSRLSSTTIMRDSNPGTLKSSIGGVGYNVSLAHKYGLKSQGKRASSRLVSVVGDDFAGHSIIKQLQDKNHDTSGIAIMPNKSTAQYSAIVNNNGELVLACADMAIMEDTSVVKHLTEQIFKAQPQFVVVDCNLLAAGLNAVIEASSKLIHSAKVIVEPTSKPKLARLSDISKLSVFPNCHIQMVTPTEEELEQIYQSFSLRELFDDYDNWFPVLDSLGIDSRFRDRMVALAAKNGQMKYLMDHGILQQCFQLLPYIPNILVKLGARGCALIKLSGCVTDYKSIPKTSPFSPEFTITSEGREYDEGKKLGVVVEYFPVPEENANLNIVDVTGAGDSLLGYLSSSLVGADWLTYEIESLEQEWAKWENLHRSQLASGKSLMSHEAVSKEIEKI